MTLAVSAADLSDWSDLFDNPDIKITLTLEQARSASNPSNAAASRPVASSGTTLPSCVNNRFFPQHGLVFESEQNTARFGQNKVADDRIALLALKKGQNLPPQSLEAVLVAAGVPKTQISGPDFSQSKTAFQRISSLFLQNVQFQLSEDQLAPPATPDDDQTRNAMWLTVNENVRIDTTLVFSPVSTPVSSLQTEIESALPVKTTGISSPTLIIQRTSYGIKSFKAENKGKSLSQSFGTSASSTKVWVITNTYKVTWKVPLDNFIVWVTLDPLGVSVSITTHEPDTSSSPTSSFWSHITNLVPALQGLSIQPEVDNLLDNLKFLRLVIRWDAHKEAQWEVLTAIHLSNGGPDMYLGYDSKTSTFEGGLILRGFYTSSKLLPDFQLGYDILLPADQSVPWVWDLRSVFGSVRLPSELPTEIAIASISYQRSKTGQPSVLSFTAQARHLIMHSDTGASSTQQKSMPSPFTWNELDVSFEKAGEKISCSLYSYFTLTAPPRKDGTTYTPANIALSFDYNDNGWALQGHVRNLSCGLLCSFFDTDSQSAALDIFGKLSIASLDLFWTHTKGGSSASFLFSGRITFGELELRLFYQYVTKDANSDTTERIQNELNKQTTKDGRPVPNALVNEPDTDSTWSFECDLGSSTDKATIGTIADSILDNASATLPSFVHDIPIPKADSSNGKTPIMLKAKKVLLDTTGPVLVGGGSAHRDGKIVFVFRFAIGAFTATFVQLADVPGDKNAKKLETKRLLRFAVDKLPMKDQIPLLDKLPQPFDQLEYVWINDAGGFTRDEIDIINTKSGLLPQEDLLIFKDPGSSKSSQDSPPRPAGSTTDKPAPNPNPVVLVPGHHFIVVQGGKVVLDHIFNASSNKDSPRVLPASNERASQPRALAVVVPSVGTAKNGTTGSSASSADPSKPAKGGLAFKAGPLSVEAVTLEYKEQAGKKQLIITLDATFTMGPMTFSLIGFGLALTLDKDITLNNLQSAIADVDVMLAGLALAFKKPPLLVAGGFEHKKSDNQDVFMGGVGVSFPPYTFVGIGEYAVFTIGSGSYKSVFLYCKLDGPLITLEFATITGVRLGLGYNSYVDPPTIDEITDFPFINDKSVSGAGNDPMALLHKLTSPGPSGKTWVAPKLDSYWFAAGLSITAFDILSVTAVAMLAFRDSGLVASIYADAIASMPPNAPQGAAIVYVEIGMVAEMNFADGYFRIEAALAPTSYLLVPQCHLYGGFALVYWFPPSDHAGDWVFSIGGYHRAYSPPAWYPVPRRLGISFNIDIISITGEAYFAVTPKCVMGGAMMHASLAFGPIEAWMDYSFDALINFHPLHYIVDFAVSIGVKCNIDILFIHIHISVHIGCQLHIEGPEFGGIAHVDFYLFGFDVDFGASSRQPDPLDLYQFFLMLHKPGPDSSSDPSYQHESPIFTYIEIHSPDFNDTNLSSAPSLIHDSNHLVDVLSGAAFKFVLEDGNFPMPADASPPTTLPETNKGNPKSTGAGSKWFVKGGSFAFRISTDHAINDAVLLTPTITLSNGSTITKRHFDGWSEVNSSSLSPITSKPMHITSKMNKTTSTLVITIRRILKLDPITHKPIFDPIPIYTWSSFALTSKSMPTAIWSPYDSLADPSNPKSPRPSTLLDGDQPTINQFMGVTLKAPLPILCPRPEWPGFIPKFRATAAAKFGILDFRKDSNGTDWFVPVSNAVQTNYLPAALDAKEEKKASIDQWDDFASSWSALSDAKKQGTVSEVLSVVATTLAWDQKRSQMTAHEEKAEAVRLGDTGKQAWELVGSVPGKLVKDMKRSYLDLPRWGVVGA